jgi:hypothetical protein
MFTKNIKDYFTDDLLNTVRGVLGEAKKCSEDCTCEKCESEKDEMTEGKRGLWDNIHAKRKRIKAGSGERMRKPGSKGAPTDDDFKAASEEVEQIHELSSDLKTRYGMKAYDQLQAAQRTAKDSDNNPAIRKLAADTARKRKAGVDRRSRMYAQDVEKQRRTYGVNKEEAEQIDELSRKTLASYVKKAGGTGMNSAAVHAMDYARKMGDGRDPSHPLRKSINRARGVERAAKKLTKEEQEFIDALNNDMFEEVDIAEANLKVGDHTATSEKSRFHDKGYRPHLKNSQGKTSYLASVAYKSPEHAAGEAAAYHKGYFGSGRPSERGADDAVRAYRHKNKAHMHEEVELEEGRGRPPKEGSAAWKARQGKADDDMVALGMQLRKAQSINKKVRFMDSKEHDIHPNHINRFNDHMAARRTSQEKAAFQKQAHKSHADFVKAVSAPVPKASKDTGEIVKYRH